MWAVISSLKRVVWLLVIYGILYVLISPLPEVDATFSGKSALVFFMLVTCALSGMLPLIFSMGLRPSRPAFFFPANVLDKICVRLC